MKFLGNAWIKSKKIEVILHIKWHIFDNLWKKKFTLLEIKNKKRKKWSFAILRLILRLYEKLYKSKVLVFFYHLQLLHSTFSRRITHFFGKCEKPFLNPFHPPPNLMKHPLLFAVFFTCFSWLPDRPAARALFKI